MLRHVELGAVGMTFAGLYAGTVANVEDEQGMGRIKVSVPAVFDEASPEYEVWARPCFPYGRFFVPEVNDKVWIAFENGDPSSPVWMGVWYPQGDVPAEADASPPKKRLIHSSSGHYILLDDDEGKVIFQDSNGNVVTLDSNGISIEDKNGNTAVMNSSGITLTDLAGASLELTSMKTWLNGLTSVFNTWVPVPQDGGAALKTALGTFLGSNPVPM